ncbi:MAG: beta-N-acetylhexosaminidase [Alphaproteobacteria bacterium]
MNGKAACALGIRQTVLDPETAAFFRDVRPWAFILFAEACKSRDQVRALTDSLREAARHDAVVFIDQEGGRVSRLKPPEWPVFPAPLAYGRVFESGEEWGMEACFLGHRLIAAELRAIGVDGDYAPVLDRPVAGSNAAVVGDRAYGSDTDRISELGAAALAGLSAGGVVGCIKHMPGHGRAKVDTHFDLPRVTATRDELQQDFAPFAALAEAPSAMTAHIIYEALDPDRPATCSPVVIENIIRGEIGFQGLLMSDDLDMKALDQVIEGGLRERAEAASRAGCDVVLQCSGKLEDMIATANGCGALDGIALVRARAAEGFAKRTPLPFDAEAGWARLRELLALQTAVA